MQLARASAVAALGLLGMLLTLAIPAPTRADGASGEWTGEAAARGNYYWERSTRVLAPEVRARLESPNGIRTEAVYMLDAITSASQATGVAVDVAFTERRHDGRLSIGKEFDLGDEQVDVTGSGRVSYEPDYFSRGGGLTSAVSLAQDNHILRISAFYLNDDVGRVVRNSTPENPDDLFKTEREHVGTLHAFSSSIGYEHTFTPTTLAIVGFDFARLSGVQQNVYRLVVPMGGGVPIPERHPELRYRNAAFVAFRQRIPATHSTLSLAYRVYRDTWEITSHAPDVRLYQDLSNYLTLRLRYRYYVQTRANFYRPAGPITGDAYVSADPKMSAFHNQTFEGVVRIDLDFLTGTGLDWLAEADLDFGFAYILNTNRFGNGVTSQAGMRVPF